MRLDDLVVSRLRAAVREPDLSGTKYRLRGVAGAGGMGTVYVVEDTELGRQVALKVLDVPDSGIEARLRREAQVLARLEHPGVVPVHDVGTLPDGRTFYTMKLVQGERVDAYVSRRPPLPERLRVFIRIADAVAFAHAHGVLHRDLKPQNVMVGAFGEVLVMDWGLAKILQDEKDGAGSPTETLPAAMREEPPDNPASADTASIAGPTGKGVVMGTPGFMSPEQARGETQILDIRSDIYSLGVILRLLSMHDSGKAGGRVPKRAVRPLEAIWLKATAQEPTLRYDTVPHLARDVARFLDGEAVKAYRENFLDKAGRFYRRYKFFILLIAAYLGMRILLLFFTLK
jgi:serine/threonine protein kinase